MLFKINNLTECPAGDDYNEVLEVPKCMNITSPKLKLFSGNCFPQIFVAWATNGPRFKIPGLKREFAGGDAFVSTRDRASNAPYAS
jgi:hypothetical protein